jgi:hypothetical protein
MSITFDNVKTGLLVAAVGVLVYAGYKIYKLGTGVTDSIGSTITEIGDKAQELGGNISDAVSDFIHGAPGETVDTSRSNQGPPPVTVPIEEPMPGMPWYVGAFLEDGRYRYTAPQDYSPSAVDDSYRG